MEERRDNEVLARIKIEGTKPVLWHRFGPHVLPLEPQERTGIAGNDPEEWRKSYLATKEGQLYFEPSYIFACIRDGGQKTKLGRGNAKGPVSSTLEVVDNMILVDRFMPEGYKDMATADFPVCPEEPVYLDIRSVRNPSTKARNIRYRVAASPGWKINFQIIWDKTIIPREVMHSIIIDAGKLCGIGDGRNIGFGRFKVIEFKEVEKESAEKKAAQGDLGRN